MATLTGQKVKNSYKDLLQVSNSNSGITGTLTALSDGEGSASYLELSTSYVNITQDKLQYGGTTITSTAAELNILDGVTTTAAELNVLDGITAGTVSASLGVVVDSNKDIGTFRNITLSGELDAGSLDISGNADIDGTLEADAYTVDGTALNEYIADTVGAMVGSNTETNITVTYEDGDNTLDFVIGTLNQDTTGTAATVTTAAQPNITSLGTLTTLTVDNVIVNGTTIGHTSDTDLMTVASGVLTVAGEVDATSLDISGDADIDGTLETDALTIGGVTSVPFESADHSKLDGIEASADVTDTANVTSAGALMDSEVTNLAFVKSLAKGISDGNVLTANDAVADNDFLRIDGTEVEGLTVAEVLSALNVESGADVTDATNVTSAGALMDSEVTDLDGIKSLTVPNSTTISTFGASLVDDANASAARTTLGVDASGTDNSTNVTLVTSSHDYLSLSGQAITLGTIDVSDDTNLTAGTNISLSGDTLNVDDAFLINSGNDTTSGTITAAGFTTTGTLAAGLADIDDVVINGTTIGHTDDTDLITLADGNVTIAGELDLTTLDVSGDADIDGTLEADAITVNGTALSSVIAGTTVSNATLAATVTITDKSDNVNYDVVFGNSTSALYDDTGALYYNPSTGTLRVPNLNVAGTTTTVDTVTMEAENAIVFEGATADAYETTLSIVDPTADRTQYLINQGGYIPVLAASTTTAISATPAELNILDGATVVVGEINYLDLGSTAVGTAIASKAVILDSNKDYTGVRNLTITGELDAATLDISGDADIDGTLEADAITVNGTALSSVISGTTVSNATTAAVATTVTITDNESTDEDNAIVFTAGGDVDGGNLGLESDGTLTYNPSTGTVTATGFSGNLTGTLQTAAQTNITSLGTLTALTVDNVAINGAVIGHTSDTDLITLSSGVVTVAGELDATSLDISGDADIDGTLETDALSINGTAVSSTAAELNVLDGYTGSVTELNYLDTLHATGVTNTEFDYLDGVTSNIQTQLDALPDTAGTNITLSGTTLNVDDAFLINSGNDTTSGTITAGGFTTTGNLSLAGHAVNDIDIGSEFVDADDHLMTSGAIKEKIESYSYLTAAPVTALNNATANELVTVGSTTTELDAEANLTFDGTYLDLPDSKYIRLGTGNDLRLYHDGTNSSIENHTGNLYIDNNTDDGEIIFRCDDGSGGVTAYMSLVGSSAITTVHKIMRFDDSIDLRLGAGSDLRLYHNGTNSYVDNYTGDLYIRNTVDDGDVIFQSDDGSGGNATYIQIDGGATITKFDKATRHADSTKLYLGGGLDFEMYHNGTNTYIANTTGDLYIQNEVDDKDVILRCDDGSGGNTAYLTLDGSAGYTTAQKHIRFEDQVEVQLGAGGDGKIYSYNDDLYIGNETQDKDIYIRANDGGTHGTAIFIDASDNRNVKLPNDNQWLYIGAGNDNYFGHDGTNSIWGNYTGTLQIRNHTSDADMFLSINDGGSHINAVQIDASAAGSVFMPNDNATLGLGAGNDLRLWHDGTNSYMYNYQGELRIGNTVDDADTVLYGDDASGGNTPYLTIDGSETRIDIHKNTIFEEELFLKDDKDLVLGNGSDLQIRHDNSSGQGWITNNTDHLVIVNNADDHDIIFKTDNGSGGTAVYMTLDGSAGLTQFDKHTKHTDSIRADFGNSSDLQIYHNGSNNYIDSITSDQDLYIRVNDGGSMINAIYINADSEGDVYLPNDYQRLYFGAGNDLQITHNGTNNYIEGYTGDLYIDNYADDKDIILRSDDGSGGVTPYLTLDGSKGYTTVQKKIAFEDSVELHLGTGNDLKMWHNGSHNYIKMANGNIYFTDDGDNNVFTFYREGGGVQLNEGDLKMPATSKLYLDGGSNTYIYEQSSNDLQFIVDAENHLQIDVSNNITKVNADKQDHDFQISGDNTTELFYVDAGNDKVGIATNSPDSYNNDGDDFVIYGTGDTGMSIVSGTSSDGSLIFADGTSGTSGYRGKLVYEHDNDAMVIYTAAGERARVDSSGHIGVGTSSPGYIFHTHDGSTDTRHKVSTSDHGTYFESGVTADSAGIILVAGHNSSILNIYLQNSGGSASNEFQFQHDGDFHADGDVVAYSTTVSDKRLKDNVKTIDNALDKVMKLRGVEFDWNQGKRKGTHDLGLIAQEVEEVLPELVRDKTLCTGEHSEGNEKEFKTVDYDKIVGVLIEAIKEQQEEIDLLKANYSDLKYSRR